MGTSAETAQDTWDRLVRQHLRPTLRKMGWRGSGNRWEIPDEHSFGLLGLQKSRRSSREEISFTINLSVVSKESWEAWRSLRGEGERALPHPGIAYARSDWSSRIGRLLPDARDTWWSVTPETDVAILGEELLCHIAERAAPAIHEQLWLRSLRD